MEKIGSFPTRRRIRKIESLNIWKCYKILKISAVNTSPVDAKKYDAFIFTSANAI